MDREEEREGRREEEGRGKERRGKRERGAREGRGLTSVFVSACGAPFASVFSSSAVVRSAKELGLGRCSPAAASASGFGLGA